MEASRLKNVLQTIIHFIETDKHIDLQNDPGNDLELFLPEFNRYRQMLGLVDYELEKRMPMLGRGDWFGRGEKVRFVPIKDNSNKTPQLEPNQPESSIDPKKITKGKILALLEQAYPKLEVQSHKEDGVATTIFLNGSTVVGSWAQGLGWYIL